MARPYWEEMGWTSEWYYHQHQMRGASGVRLTAEQLSEIIRKHGDKARAELRSMVRSGNYQAFVWIEAHLNAGWVEASAAPLVQHDLFPAEG